MRKRNAGIGAFLIGLLVWWGIPSGVWAEGNPIRVGFFPIRGFYEQDAQGRRSGYGVEYLNRLAGVTGWTYEYVDVQTWQEALACLVKGQIDLLAPVQITPERQEQFAFSAYAVGIAYGGILALDTNDALVYEDFDALSHAKIGCVETATFRGPFIRYIAEHGITPTMTYYPGTDAMYAALNAGEVDAIVVNLMTQTENTKLLGKFGAAPFYYMLNQRDTALQETLAQALSQIKTHEPTLEVALTAQYYPQYTVLPFTKAEIQDMQKARTLRVGCPGYRDPISYVEEQTGEVTGMTREIMDQIAQISGLHFTYVAYPPGQITYDDLRRLQIDLITGAEQIRQNENSPGIQLSLPYLSARKVLVGRKGQEYDLTQPLIVAIATGSEILGKAIQERHPNFMPMFCKNIDESFAMVHKGTADLLLDSQYTVERLLAKPLYETMTTLPMVGLDERLCISSILQNDGDKMEIAADERLLSILNKSIARMTEEKRDAIIIKYTVNRPYQYVFTDFIYQYRYLLLALAVGALPLCGMSAYVLQLRRRHMTTTRDNERKLKNITDNINGGVVVLVPNAGLKIVYANEGFLALIQYTKAEHEQLLAQDYVTYVHPQDIDQLNVLVGRMGGETEHISIRLRIVRRDGSYVPTLFNGTIAENADGTKELYCVIMDISEQIRMIEQLDLEQKRYGLIVEKSGEIIYEMDLVRRQALVSLKFLEKFGWSFPKTLLGTDDESLLSLWRVCEADASLLAARTAELLQHHVANVCTVRLCRTDDTALWCEISQYPMLDSQGNLCSVVGRILDVDESMREKEALRRQSRTDPMTGLCNKEAFHEESTAYLATCDARHAAVIFLDLDHFKNVNDTLGHIAGDQVIVDTARKLEMLFSSEDLLARFGGDEFCVLVKCLPYAMLEKRLEQMVRTLRADYEAQGHTAAVSASIGAVCAAEDGVTLQQMMQCADRALYQAKMDGRNRYVLVDGLNDKEGK